MFKKEVNAIESIVKKLRVYENILNVIAFGSRTRGDFSDESDFDVLVVVDRKTPALLSSINKIFYSESLKSNIPFSAVVLSIESFSKNRKFNTGFYRNIKKDGVVFYGSNP